MPALSRGLAASLLPFKLTRLLSVTSRGRRCCSGVAGDTSSESDEDDVDALVGQKWDVVISGAGLAGAALACALGTAEAFSDKRVLLIDRRTLCSDHDEENWSNRVYALTPGSKSFLQAWGLMAASVDRVKDGCERDLLDRCSVSLFFFTGGARIPGSAQELAKTCAEEQKDRQCVTDYTQKCLEGIPRGMVQLVLDGSSNVGREKCTVGSPGHTRYMKHAECLNIAGDKIHRCMKRLTGILEASAEHHERKHKIGLACCSFGGYRQCIVDAVKGSCDDSHVAYAHDLIQSYAGELLDTVCINYKPGDESCGGLPTLLPKDAPRSLSPIPPLTDVLQVFV